jgi:hypothetical protein
MHRRGTKSADDSPSARMTEDDDDSDSSRSADFGCGSEHERSADFDNVVDVVERFRFFSEPVIVLC